MAMLTQCPQCSAVFRLHAATLSAAHGFVTCGDCDAVFSALNRLADEPVSIAAPNVPAPTPAIEPRAISIENSSDLDNVPAILRHDVERLLRDQRAGLRWVWTLLAGLAALVLLTQVAWVNREWVLEHYPFARPYASQWCARLGCQLDRPLAARIELVSRDVREHPNYANALLVNAMLANRTRSVAAYPVIQLGVHDRNGSVVGIRRFQPDEYLDQSIDVAAGIPPGRTVYVVLEIAGASDVADSFEFIFL